MVDREFGRSSAPRRGGMRWLGGVLALTLLGSVALACGAGARESATVAPAATVSGAAATVATDPNVRPPTAPARSDAPTTIAAAPPTAAGAAPAAGDPTAAPPEPPTSAAAPPTSAAAPTAVESASSPVAEVTAASVAETIGPYGRPREQVEAQVEAWLASMSDEQKVGQLLLVGFEGYDAESGRYLVDDLHAGSIVFLNNTADPGQTMALTAGLQSIALEQGRQVPLLIAVDHEGGTVQRLRNGVASFPGNMALGATFSTDDARLQGEVHGRELRALGINVNLAPVLDVNDEPTNPVIGLRSFGSDPARVAVMGQAYLEGMQGAGVLAVGKHFPGHGSTTQDSHLTLPTVDASPESVRLKEIAPFRAAIEAGIAAIMTAHIVFPQIDPDNPATLSSIFLTDLLRGELGYDGLVMTDDTGGMRAITDHYSAGEAALQSVLAGADLVLVAGPRDRQESAYQALLGAVRDGRITSERLDASVRRVLRAKAGFEVGDPARAGDPASVGSAEHLAAAQRVADDGVTLVRDRDGLVPLVSNGPGRVLVVASAVLPHGDLGTALQTGFLAHGWQAEPEILFDLEAGSIAAAGQQAVAAAGGVDLIVVATISAGPAQRGLIESLLASGTPVVVVGCDLPYELGALPSVSTYVATYGTSWVAGLAAVNLLHGETQGGWLPVDVPGVGAVGASARGDYQPPLDQSTSQE